MNAERDYFWYRLFKTHGIGAKSLADIVKILEKKNLSGEILLANRSGEIMQHPKLAKYSAKISQEDEDKVLAEYELLKDSSVDIIHPRHPSFPPHLLEIAPMLFIAGQRMLLTSESVAIVGSRNVSDTGACIARELAGQLANKKLNIVSGYAKGVDHYAHLGALAAGGTTTMVLPYGIMKLRQDSAFREFNWRDDVLVVSQFNPGDRWREYNAMIRNKLICALSKAVVVIESGPERDAQGKMSGTFNTAQTSLRMSLPLFVINPECFDNPPIGNANLIDLGGERLDSDGAAETISKHVFGEKTELSPGKKQDSHVQLEFL